MGLLFPIIVIVCFFIY
ncbi:TPA: hypothetical protein PDM17_002741 [Staphylococcus aureus]|nr:hypothetical protein [Staphylococcus aureus]